MTGRRERLAAAAGLALLVLATVLPRVTGAAGEDHPARRAKDLILNVSTKWAGSRNGGYYPIRIQVQNRGPDCTLRFVFDAQQEGMADVERTLDLAQNATVKFTLPVPLVGYGTWGHLQVYRNGRLVKELQESLSLPDTEPGAQARPALLVISPNDIGFDHFEMAVSSLTPAVGGSYGGYGYAASEDHERVEPTMLPEEWIAYSGLDIVAVPLDVLGKFSTSERAALMKWVATGGTLAVYDVNEPAEKSTRLNDLLGIDQHAAVSPEWQSADLKFRRKIVIVEEPSYGAYSSMTIEEAVGEDQPEYEFEWPAEPSAFARRDLMWGHVYAFKGQPFTGSPHDWGWFLKSLPSESKSWTRRHGLSARSGSDEFLKFLIPSVSGVPVIPFLLLITLFTIVIGPLNYIMLWRRRRLYLLVLTIPLIALGTSFALFGYSAIAHGFGTRSRARSVTFVDQRANVAVTTARLALFAGLAPSTGINFSPDTAVYPIWPENHSFESATTDWTEQQNLRSWLKSRTRTQFLTVGHRDERGRIEVDTATDADAGDRLKMTNGFEWDIESLLISDSAGQLYYGTDIPAGASAELSVATSEQTSEFTKLLSQFPLEAPDEDGRSSDWFDMDWSSYGYNAPLAATFEAGQLEQTISIGRNPQHQSNRFPAQMYSAILTENPGIELGMPSTSPQASLHVLMGRY